MQGVHSVEAARAGIGALNAVFSHEMDPYRPETIDPKGFFAYDLMVSNLGVVEPLRSNTTVVLKELYQCAVSPENDDAQVVSCITYEDRACFLHVSRRPIPGLLDAALKLLVSLTSAQSS